MGAMKEILHKVAEELYPDNEEEQDKFFERALNGTLLDHEKDALGKLIPC